MYSESQPKDHPGNKTTQNQDHLLLNQMLHTSMLFCFWTRQSVAVQRDGSYRLGKNNHITLQERIFELFLLKKQKQT